MKNQKTMGNKGFSLVELIVVIAIMVVLVAVLAPVFTKYVEQSRRATDIQNANSIAEAIMTDAADGHISGDVALAELTDSHKPEAIQTVPAVRGTLISDAHFEYSYTASTNTATVVIKNDSVTTGDLTQELKATNYRDAKTTNDLTP